jgi:uncharacterized surface protein with fasciclin (FAS1) repeats
LSKFANYIQTFGAGLQGVIANADSGTIFAPNNDAFDRLSQSDLETLLGSKNGPRILGMHFINQRIPAEDVRILQPQNKIKVNKKSPKFSRNDPLLVDNFCAIFSTCIIQMTR